ncbi:MAG: hypothetical protein U0793_15580 [Gemmataceae bacterium]
MLIHFPCPSCHDQIRVSEHLSGLSHPCPVCRASVLVPAGSVGEWAPEPERLPDVYEAPTSRVNYDYHPGADEPIWNRTRVALGFELALAATALLWQILLAIFQGFALLILLGALRPAP